MLLAKSNGYNQRNRQNRTINTRRGAWRVESENRLISDIYKSHIKSATKSNNQIRTVFGRNFLDFQQLEISSFLFYTENI